MTNDADDSAAEVASVCKEFHDTVGGGCSEVAVDDSVGILRCKGVVDVSLVAGGVLMWC